jgi:hypothetical protein
MAAASVSSEGTKRSHESLLTSRHAKWENVRRSENWISWNRYHKVNCHAPNLNCFFKIYLQRSELFFALTGVNYVLSCAVCTCSYNESRTIISRCKQVFWGTFEWSSSIGWLSLGAFLFPASCNSWSIRVAFDRRTHSHSCHPFRIASFDCHLSRSRRGQATKVLLCEVEVKQLGYFYVYSHQSFVPPIKWPLAGVTDIVHCAGGLRQLTESWEFRLSIKCTNNYWWN